jgi:hypothetical protein
LNSRLLMRKITPKKAIILVTALFVVSIFIRLPNLNRPLSKHYEFNSAVILINIISWRQAGGGGQLNYTPVMNFQNAGDKYLPINLGFDKNGNSIYLSFGPGWYLIPYFFYQWFHLPADPIYLEMLNLLFHFSTVLVFFRLMEMIVPAEKSGKYTMILAGCCFLIFSPGVLWFMGNGYVNTGIMLPFLIGVFLLILPMFGDPKKITPGRLTLLSLLIIILAYIDWYIIFLCFICGIIAIAKFRKNKVYGWMIFVIVTAALSGVALIFFQFSSHVGYEVVLQYWQTRYSNRRMHITDGTLLEKFSFVFLYFLTSYFPLFLIMLLSLLKTRRRLIFTGWSNTELLFIRMIVSSLLLYNLTLFHWSAEHEFSVLPWCLLLSFLGGRILGIPGNQKSALFLIAVFFIFSIVQYYWINRPGLVSRDGTPYASFENLGRSLRNIPADQTICIDLEQNPMVEYYARRNLLRIHDSLSSGKVLTELGIKKAVWVNQRAYKVENIRIIR